MGRVAGWWGVCWRITLAVPGLIVSGVVAFGAFPLGVWVGWRVASGVWWWPVEGRVSVFMVLSGVLVGGLTYKFGLLLREGLVGAWREGWERHGSDGI
jgi:hypothetical protein